MTNNQHPIDHQPQLNEGAPVSANTGPEGRDSENRDPESRDFEAGSWRGRLAEVLGPGLITGASDDDPSGIATYSQAGAQFGYAQTWVIFFSYPLMVAAQLVSARIGRVTGHGIAGVLRAHYPVWLLQSMVLLLFIANVINLGADLGAMADAVTLLFPAPRVVLVLGFGGLCIWMQIFLQYSRYVAILKWLTVSLFAYVGTVLIVQVDWTQLASDLFIPRMRWEKDYITTVVAVLGTTISPYLFFWQSSEEAEDIVAYPRRMDLIAAPEQGDVAMSRIEWDTWVGMGLSNVIAMAIMVTTAATLHVNGITDVQTSAQAAEALKPLAGHFAFLLFTLGIVGTGLLAVPVLGGSAAYALGEARNWPIGLSKLPKQAVAFYGTLALATVVGMILCFLPIDPIAALYWSAVINGVIAVPLMVVMMLVVARKDIMGLFAARGALLIGGWIATAVMAVAVIAMFATYFL